MTTYDDFYPWAPSGLRRECSCFTSDHFITRYRRGQQLCQSNEQDVLVTRCELDELVCANESTDSSGPFCFFYATLFSKVGLRLPLSSFEKDLLTVLNVAPAQLHPNSWAFVRAFHILCTHFGVVPTPNVFLYFFEMKKPHKNMWSSLNSAGGRGLLTLFQSSYKGFKGGFLKIRAPPHKADLLEGFPLYWTQNPSNSSPRQLSDLSSSEKEYCLMLEQLRAVFDTKQLLELEFQPTSLKRYIESRMGMSKQDLAKRFKALRSSSQASLVQATPLAQEGVTVVSDEEATQSGSGLKRRPSLSKSKALVGETAGVSTRSEHTLSSKGPLLQEGSSNVCCSFRDSQFNHRAHSRAHNVFDGDLHCLLNQEVDTIQEDIDRFLHKTEVSVAALCDKLSRVSVLEKDWLAELALTKTHLIAAKEEVARLSKEVDGLQGLKVKLRARGEDNRAGD